MEIMNLKAYLANINLKIKDFCELIDCDPCFISSVMHGKKYVSKKLQQKVYEVTDGQVILPCDPSEKRRKMPSILNK